MSEGYLRFFTGDKALVISAGLESHGVHPLTVQVMGEDNIDISGQSSKSFHRFRQIRFDYLITVCDEAASKLPRYLKARRHIHFSIPDPNNTEGSPDDRLRCFREVREAVKKNMLRFIGQELMEKTETVA